MWSENEWFINYWHLLTAKSAHKKPRRPREDIKWIFMSSQNVQAALNNQRWFTGIQWSLYQSQSGSSFAAIISFNHFHVPFSPKRSGDRHGCPITVETGVNACISAHGTLNPTEKRPPIPKNNVHPNTEIGLQFQWRDGGGKRQKGQRVPLSPCPSPGQWLK